MKSLWLYCRYPKLELSSLRSQLECWNNGTMEYWVLGNWDSDLLENPIDKEVNK